MCLVWFTNSVGVNWSITLDIINRILKMLLIVTDTVIRINQQLIADELPVN